LSAKRRVKVFRYGQSQAVPIPRGFELSSEDAVLRKDGERIIVEPVPVKSLLALLATLAPLGEEFPPVPDPPAAAVDL
jgi:antitoxin VapB